MTGGSKGPAWPWLPLRCIRADVAILARGRQTLDQAEQTIIGTARGRIVAITCDISKANGFQRGYDAAVGAFGRVDIAGWTSS